MTASGKDVNLDSNGVILKRLCLKKKTMYI
jgi:hypothetical protein